MYKFSRLIFYNRAIAFLLSLFSEKPVSIFTSSGPFYSCQEAYTKGYKRTSVLPIYVPGMDVFNIRCDMATDGGGWIIFQRRVDASVDFYLGWEKYKNGFGDPNGNFWLGLEKIHKLASPGRGAILRVDMKHLNYPHTVKYAKYKKFEILSESQGYMLKIGDFSGNAGDAFSGHNGAMFSTKDRDLDSWTYNCAQAKTGAWWYGSCFNCQLNGLYPTEGQTSQNYMSWYHLDNSYGRIIFSEMKIKYSPP